MKGISFDNGKIIIKGKQEKIISGAIHYFRVPPIYWEDRLLKLKEMGCNCVETYVCWNLHEKEEGKLDFSEWLDFGRFLDLAKKIGLYAIIRPGPYICSEWDFGGLPWWLLKYDDIVLRSSNPTFIGKLTPYLKKVCEIVKKRTIGNGGNVIFVQVENEYGAYGNDKKYLNYLKEFYLQNGINCALITSDWDLEEQLIAGTLPDVAAAVNYRSDSIHALNELQKWHKGFPLAVLELWNGKAKHWGETFNRRDIEEVKESVALAIKNAELVNLYMFHGGTSFGFMNGMDNGEDMIVQMTSYDVDAPVNEYGDRTKKYYAEKEAIEQYTGKHIKLTATDPVRKCYDAQFCGELPLDEFEQCFGQAVESTIPLTMEQLNEPYGYVMYETDIYISGDNQDVILPDIHDIAHIYDNDRYLISLARSKNLNKIVNISGNGIHKIKIIVENLGRVNFGRFLNDKKGLVGVIRLGRIFNFNYKNTPIPLKKLPKVLNGKARENYPCFYSYKFNAVDVADTVLYLNGFTRGVAFINDFNLGRHWDIENSENKLFIPAPFIKPGENEIIVFDVLANKREKSILLKDE